MDLKYSDYYEMCSNIEEKIEKHEIEKCSYIPSDYDLDFFRDFFEQTFFYCIYIIEYHITVEDDYSKNQLNKAADIFYEKLNLIE